MSAGMIAAWMQHPTLRLANHEMFDPNVFIDTSAYAAYRYPAELVDYMKGRGKRKVLFGTNYPMLRPARAPARLDELGRDDETRELLLRDNARRVFRLEGCT